MPSTGLTVAIAVASGAPSPRRVAAPSSPCATTCTAMYSARTKPIDRMIARGTVRRGSATSPLAPSGVSMPEKANSAKITARPKPPPTVAARRGAGVEVGRVDEPRADADEQRERHELDHGRDRQEARREADAAQVDERQPADDRDDQRGARQARAERRDRGARRSAKAAAMPPHDRTLDSQMPTKPVTKPARLPNAASTVP